MRFATNGIISCNLTSTRLNDYDRNVIQMKHLAVHLWVPFWFMRKNMLTHSMRGKKFPISILFTKHITDQCKINSNHSKTVELFATWPLYLACWKSSFMSSNRFLNNFCKRLPSQTVSLQVWFDTWPAASLLLMKKTHCLNQSNESLFKAVQSFGAERLFDQTDLDLNLEGWSKKQRDWWLMKRAFTLSTFVTSFQPLATEI